MRDHRASDLVRAVFEDTGRKVRPNQRGMISNGTRVDLMAPAGPTCPMCRHYLRWPKSRGAHYYRGALAENH